MRLGTRILVLVLQLDAGTACKELERGHRLALLRQPSGEASIDVIAREMGAEAVEITSVVRGVRPRARAPLTAPADQHSFRDSAEPSREARLHKRLRDANDRFQPDHPRRERQLGDIVVQLWTRFRRTMLARAEDEFLLHTLSTAQCSGRSAGNRQAARAAMSEHVALSCHMLITHSPAGLLDCRRQHRPPRIG